MTLVQVAYLLPTSNMPSTISFPPESDDHTSQEHLQEQQKLRLVTPGSKAPPITHLFMKPLMDG